MPRNTQATTVAGPPAAALEEARSAVLAMGAHILQEAAPDGSFKAATGVSFFSWGELITVTVASATEGTTVTVESKSRFPLTLVDYGRNARNVRRVIEGLKQTV